ncbi:hypothetical protein [Klebsiella pneumoniae]|uniref:hypothetical protein n=1 Tax=Klebsiella pneumoniae TaxID=573 RepID=UPI003F4A6317
MDEQNVARFCHEQQFCFIHPERPKNHEGDRFANLSALVSSSGDDEAIVTRAVSMHS